jgi:hypothetical protein
VQVWSAMSRYPLEYCSRLMHHSMEAETGTGTVVELAALSVYGFPNVPREWRRSVTGRSDSQRRYC